MKLGIIGYGTMGRTIARRLLSKKLIDRRGLVVSKNNASNHHVLRQVSVIILAVKPQDAATLLVSLRPLVTKQHVLVSIMAGISLRTIARLSGAKKIIRAMPNTPARVGKGVTAWIASPSVPRTTKRLMQHLFQTLGVEHEVRRESDIDRATALFGSGPAYVFYFLEALHEAGKKLGFSPKDLPVLTSALLDGSLELLRVSHVAPEILRAQVTSKKGTTAAAIQIFDQKKLKAIIIAAVHAAYQRAQALSRV